MARDELTLPLSQAARPLPDRILASVLSRADGQPASWRFSTRALATRLFLTCWLVYALHWATDVVREIYPAIALGDHLSFRVDEYQGLHPDLFDKPGFGWHIGNNPGGSMLAAIPYALARPVIDPIVARARAKRLASGQTEPPTFSTPRPNARKFYAEAWRRGLDIKLGLAAFVMHFLCMAPVSALGVVAMFYALRQVFQSDRTAVWLALLYAFGTPVFFRTGFLNHNLMLGHFTFLGFLALWNPSGSPQLSLRTRHLLAGLAGGTAVLFDYSGLVFLMGLFVYALVKRYRASSVTEAVRSGLIYVVGTLGPILLLWFYQWKSFGHPFLPGQHWMPPVLYIDRGYQGYSGPQFDLMVRLLFDHHFGLFLCAPVLMLALVCPWLNRGSQRRLPRLEEAFLLGLFATLLVFFSANNYTRLQANTGLRYMAPILPFLFLPAAVALMRLRLSTIYAIALFSITISWALAMYRQVIGPLGLLEPLVRFFTQGFTLPALTTLSQTSGQYGDYFARGVSPLPLFALAAAVLYALWSVRFRSAAALAGAGRTAGVSAASGVQ
jgi:hypothetical protein